VVGVACTAVDVDAEREPNPKKELCRVDSLAVALLGELVLSFCELIDLAAATRFPKREDREARIFVLAA
jgi:hypothetical protein